jgi:hypothetical protein
MRYFSKPIEYLSHISRPQKRLTLTHSLRTGTNSRKRTRKRERSYQQGRDYEEQPGQSPPGLQKHK